jgi:hypothetical protein
VTKVYDTGHFGFENAEIIVAGTGASAYIARAAELIKEKGLAPQLASPRSLATVVEDAIGEMAERYGGGEDGLDLELLVGVYCKDCRGTANSPLLPIGLYSVYPPGEDENVGVAESVADYAAMGTGGLFARYLLNRLHDEDHPTKNLPMDAAIHEAVYVIEEVTKVDLYCGGPTQLLCIEKNADGYILDRKKPKEIREIISDLAAKDVDIKKKQREVFAKSSPPARSRN